MSWLKDNKEIIEQLINYQFHNTNLLIQAFTRRSYHEEHSVEELSEDNEVLEFVGDRSLDLVVIKTLTKLFGISEKNPNWMCFKTNYLNNEHKEAIFTEIKEDLVQAKSLAEIIDNKLSSLLRMGNGDIKQGINNQAKVKEDLFEALIGAVTIDCDYNLQIIGNCINQLINLDEYFKHYHPHHIDYVSIIKEWGDKWGINLASYLNDWENISDDINIPHWGNKFEIVLEQSGNPISFVIGPKGNKKECKQELAKKIYDYLLEHHLIDNKYKS